MVFNSLQFLPFAIAVLLLHLVLPWKIDRYFLLFANYLFYASFSPPFVIFLALATVLDFIFGWLIYSAESAKSKKFLLIASIAVNLSILGYFKYINFFLNSLHFLGIEIQTRFDIVVPLGISFYIFHSMSYTFDIYRGKLKPSNFLDFALFVSFFTQLVAGPIVRARHFIPQLKQKKFPSFHLASLASWLIVLGYFKKVVIADNLAGFVGDVFSNPANFAEPDRLLALFGFATQIYCDFSGYTDIAIGMSLLFGIRLRRNFRLPYLARGVTDFWRRWHISLSTWIRDYLYFSLGGSRKGAIRNMFNVLITMGISGLWHGASWMFVLWGLLHGVYILIERGYNRLASSASAYVPWINSVRESMFYRICSISVTFFAVLVGWIFFRAQNFGDAMLFLDALRNIQTFPSIFTPFDKARDESIYIAMFFGFHVLYYFGKLIRMRFNLGATHWAVHSAAMALMLFAIINGWESTNLFIYFQF